MINTRSGIERKARAAEKDLSSQNGSNAELQATIDTAELFMQALSLADNPADRKRLDAKTKDLIARAEKLKASRPVTDVPDASITAESKAPVSKRKLTTRENIIILEGSKLNGFIFKPWEKPPAPEEFQLNSEQQLFTDSPTLSLSSDHLESFDGWKRPTEALSLLKFHVNGKQLPNVPTMQHDGNADFVQDLTSDCSVVASLCAGNSRADHGHVKIARAVVHPYDFKNDRMALSPNGKYILKFFFNGCWRRVEIDDTLPASKTSRVLHVVDRSHPGLLWPALIEKAYLKVRGGYDFPGSNSGTDIAVLTGWIPQQVFLHDEDVEPEKLWQELYDAFKNGHNILTMGTGKLSRREQKQLGLVAEHDYAVLDMQERGTVKEMLIKNPWADGDVWKGASRRKPNHVSADSPMIVPVDKTVEMLPGTFWMDFNSVFQHYENLYVNWNSSLFKHRQDRHLTWQLDQSRPTSTIIEDHPQLAITPSGSGEIWLLLNRHFRTGDYTQATNGKNGYISLYLFDNGRKMLSSEEAQQKGPFVDSPNTLLRFKAQTGRRYTAVIVQQHLPAGKHNFTVSLLSNIPAELDEATAQRSISRPLTASWTRSNAGGNSESPNYLSNPQFKLHLQTDQDVALLLRILDADGIPVYDTDIHVKLLVVASDGQRITRLRSRDVAGHSGDYRRSSATFEKTLSKGLYTVICSTFDNNHYSKFMLNFFSPTEQASIERLPAEDGGRRRMHAAPAVFKSGCDRLILPVQVEKTTRAIIIARQGHRSSTSSLFRLTLEQGQGPYRETLKDSSFDDEGFHPIATGLRIEDIDLRPSMSTQASGGLWLAVERLSRGSDRVENDDEVVQVELLVEELLIIGPWGRGAE